MRELLAVVAIVLCVHPLAALRAGEKLEILHDIAIRHVANRERIVTWKGNVEVLDSYVRPNETQTTACEVAYALNRPDDLYRWTFRQLKMTRIVDGKTETDVHLYQVGGVRTKEGVTRLDAFDREKKNDPQSLGIHAADYFHPGPGSLDFDPMYFFQEGSRTVEACFQQFYEMSERPHPGRTTTLEGTRVIYRSDFNSVNQFTVDLAQGANLVESLFKESDQNGELAMETKINTSYSMISGIWVPSKVVFASRRPKAGTSFTRTFNWVSQTLNTELEDTEFNLATIGARDGDLVSDNRSGIGLTIKDGGLVPAATVPFHVAVPESRFVRWIVILGTSFVVFAGIGILFYQKRRRMSH